MNIDGNNSALNEQNMRKKSDKTSQGKSYPSRFNSFFYKKDRMFKIQALCVVFIVLIFVFIIGFFSINFLMSIAVGSGQEVIVPDLSDLHFDVARKKLIEMDLFVQQIELRHHDEIAQNRIISQLPEPNKKTKKNRTIEVVVSLGPELVRVPYLDNITEKEARIRLENIGLVLGDKVFRYSEDVPKDRIIGSQPLADSFVARGSVVRVYISLGKLPEISDRHQRYRDVLDNIE